MQVLKTISGIRKLRQQLSGSVGFVATMGYLHNGHLALVKQARAETGVVVASIFVNPTQFAPSEDLTVYPRDLKRDLKLLEQEKTDIVFIPSEEEMYPARFNTWIDVEGITAKLEGACRPGHFRGVATVVGKLFNIIQPTRAYFGQKDAQQSMVIKRMVADLNMDLEIVVVPTVRESDGLAMSSRNTYLDPEERPAATVLFKALSLAKELWQQGEKDADQIRRQMTSRIEKEPLAKINYISIVDVNTLEELKIIKPPALASLAVKIGKTRLIDNILLEQSHI
ncbi:MAG: pantoate--beta-alanine ligase [Chloroflexota bacterium]|nr:pantoate--beta-alanine ligase [Chloroflexota bacterium]